jgi:DNA invertase Pin-like site-specific DNA recombinase
MISAIYARKSTDQAVADEQKSVTRQITHAREYAERKGWIVRDDLVFVDDGISGAEFANRPGFLRLMNALKPRPAFQFLIMSEESRLGREAIETAYVLKQLVQAGVRVFFYLEDRERTLDSPTDKIMLSLTTFADELEREKARQRTYDAMSRKAKAGHVTGGRVFGYDNVAILGPSGERSHVERRINETEAAVVRRIFEMSAAGNGYTRIAKTLNAERVVSPRPQQKRPSGWAPTSVKEVLDRSLYRGEVVWNRTRKRDSWGQQRQSARPTGEWFKRSAPELRIVSDDQWNAAHARLSGIRAILHKATGGRHSARARDVESSYLLAGFARCGSCGGALGVISRRRTGTARRYHYGCLVYNKRGASVCGNRLTVPIDRVDAAVLSTLADDVLKPAIVDAVISGVLEALEPHSQARTADAYRAELKRVESELARLTDAIAAGGTLTSLLAAVQARQARRDELLSAIAMSEARAITCADRKAIERHVRAKLADWRRLLTDNVQDGRTLLRHVLTGPFRFMPEDGRYRFEGEAALGRLLEGSAGQSTLLASPRGKSDLYRRRGRFKLAA